MQKIIDCTLSLGKNNNRKVLTVNSYNIADTVEFDIYNTYPDTLETSILAHDRISGFDIFFIGKRQNGYYTILNQDTLGAKAELRALLLKRYGTMPIPGINYKTLSFRFINHKLID